MRTIFLSLLLILAQVCTAELKITDINGRTIEVEVVLFGEDSVTIRKVSDGSIFDLPFSRLSAASINDLKKQKSEFQKRTPKTVPGDWRRLEVTLPNPFDEVSGSGMGNGSRYQTGACTYVMHLPVGCWVKANLKTQNRLQEHIVRFEGQSKRWEFTVDEHLTLLEKDGNGKQVTGITFLEHSTFDDCFAPSKLGPFAETVCIEFQSPAQVLELDRAPVNINAICATNYGIADSEMMEISKLDINALAIDMDYDEAKSLKHFERHQLESCSLEFLEEPTDSDGNRLANYPLELPHLPHLKFFSGFFNVVPLDLDKELVEKTPNLKAITISASSPKAKFLEAPRLSELKHLESLNVPWGVRLQPDVLTGISNLKVFRNDNNTFNLRNPGMDNLAEIGGMLQLTLRQSKIPGDMMKRWANSGRLSQLIEYEGYRDLDFFRLSNLETVTLRRNKTQKDDFNLSSLGTLKKLKSIKLYDATQDELETIANLPNASEIDCVSFNKGTITDLRPLIKLTGLKRLELRYLPELKECDLSLFPNLEALLLWSSPLVEEIVNLHKHQNLKMASISFCQKLESIGDSWADSKIQSIYFSALDQFTDLAPLTDAPNLAQLSIYYCDSLTNPLGIDLDKISHVMIYGCDNLPDRFPHK